MIHQSGNTRRQAAVPSRKKCDLTAERKVDLVIGILDGAHCDPLLWYERRERGRERATYYGQRKDRHPRNEENYSNTPAASI